MSREGSCPGVTVGITMSGCLVSSGLGMGLPLILIIGRGPRPIPPCGGLVIGPLGRMPPGIIRPIGRLIPGLGGPLMPGLGGPPNLRWPGGPPLCMGLIPGLIGLIPPRTGIGRLCAGNAPLCPSMLGPLCMGYEPLCGGPPLLIMFPR